MANLVKTGLGGSRIKKESEKREGYYWDPPLWIPGDGIKFEYVEINTLEQLESASQDKEGRILYPQASQTITGLKVTTSGYSGTVDTASGVNLVIVNGVIVSAE